MASDAPTYADALAACVARYGEPTDAYRIHGRPRAWWGVGGGRIVGTLLAETHTGSIELSAHHGDRAQRWTLTGDGYVTPFPAALDAADAWRRA